MSKECSVCGKRPLKACKVSFSNKHHIYRQNPNLQSVKALVKGVAKRVKVCTSCIKANKVVKAV
ncbi:MAG: 50S ribosomal protein L28 [bacterium]